MCFNRTFMELKSDILENIECTELSFNRTFMELKSGMVKQHL